MVLAVSFYNFPTPIAFYDDHLILPVRVSAIRQIFIHTNSSYGILFFHQQLQQQIPYLHIQYCD